MATPRLCVKCNERPAVIFLSRIEGEKTLSEGYCIQCASSLGIGPINDMIKGLGISPEEMDEMNDQILEMYDQIGEGDENFLPGGAATLPFQKLFGKAGGPEGGEQGDAGGKPGAGKPAGDSAPRRDKDKQKKSYIEDYSVNLTRRARDGQLDRIVGREREIYRVIQILNRRQKNNPCLIGEPGVGKTAVVEGLALRIAEGNVPSKLRDKEVCLLDLTGLVAGTQFRGQFESRIKGLVDEIKARGDVILFIDEIHNLVGAGDAEGSMNAANILKPALSRGEIQVIGATTFNEYRKHIEKDAALERRFQPVTVEEPSLADTAEMLRGIKVYYEKYHGLSIPEAVILSAVQLSERYITDRYLPDKAIDLIDEAGSHANLRHPVFAQLDTVRRECALLRKKIEEAEAKEEIDYEAIANLKAVLLQQEGEEAALAAEAGELFVTEADLAAVVELWTGIPAAKVERSEFQRLRFLEANMKQKIIGQDEAVAAVVSAIRRSRAGIAPRRRPASMIFIGPTGVGKTETAKVLAGELFDGVEPLIRLDMSEYMEKHSVSKFIGSPPGYIGYDEAGQLTEKVRRKPYSVILFDEIEKAHPDVLNILLQILDEGRITDARGRRVNFQNCVIIMTSNAGSDRQGGSMGFGKTASDLSKEKAMKALSEFLRPEFIARVDEIVVFSPLSEEDLAGIARLMLDEYREPLREKGVVFRYTDEVPKLIARRASGKKSASRELRTLIRKEIEDPLAALLIEEDSAPSAVEIATRDDKFLLLFTESPAPKPSVKGAPAQP